MGHLGLNPFPIDAPVGARQGWPPGGSPGSRRSLQLTPSRHLSRMNRRTLLLFSALGAVGAPPLAGQTPRYGLSTRGGASHAFPP